MDAVDPDPRLIEDVESEAVALRGKAYRLARDDPQREARWERWQQENAEGIAAYNRWFEKEGYRLINTSLL